MFGKIAFSREALKIDAQGVHKISAASFTNCTGIYHGQLILLILAYGSRA